jgi:hypothetical protein
MVMESDVTNNE